MSHSDYDVLFVDVGATLIGPRDGVGRQYALAAGETIGAEPPEREIGKRFNAIFERRRRAALAEGRLAYGSTEAEGRAFWRLVVHEVFSAWEQDEEKLERLFDRLFARFARPESWQVYPDAQRLLDVSRARGVPIVVVSNWDARLPETLANTGLEGYFDHVVGSYAVGAEKPDSHIFEVALSLLPPGTEASRVMHVGDRFEDDYEGGVGAGLQARHLDRAGRYGPHPHRIASLTDLLPEG